MKIFSVITLFILTSSSSIHALPQSDNFEIIGIRGYIDVPLHMQTRGDIELFDIKARGDGDGKQLKKAGDVLDKVGMGLTVAQAAMNAAPVVGQIASTAMTVIKTAVSIFSKVLSAIGNAQHKDALKRGAFTQDVVQQTLQKHPGWNCIVVHTKHDFKPSSNAKQGTDWAHSHQELKVKFPVGSTIGFEIYTFREGTFKLNGDGGFQNWAYGGNVVSGTAKSKNLVFGKSDKAKGSAADAQKGTGQKAAKDAGKKAKAQAKAEKKKKK